MKKAVNLWSLMGFAITSLAGTLLHFLYEWLNESAWIAPFSAINESTWEHMKLLFWPMFIFAIVQSFFYKDNESFWLIKLKSILLGLALIPIIFYTYNGVIGRSPDWINIAIFFVSAGAAYLFDARQFNKALPSRKNQRYALLILILIALTFAVFTFNPPDWGIFKEPNIS